MTESWATQDTWRSIWDALAIVNGDDPDDAVEKHRRWCESREVHALEKERAGG